MPVFIVGTRYNFSRPVASISYQAQLLRRSSGLCGGQVNRGAYATTCPLMESRALDLQVPSTGAFRTEDVYPPLPPLQAPAGRRHIRPLHLSSSSPLSSSPKGCLPRVPAPLRDLYAPSRARVALPLVSCLCCQSLPAPTPLNIFFVKNIS